MNPTTHSSATHGKVPLHANLRPLRNHAVEKQPSIETELFRITASNLSEVETRSALRKTAVVGAGAIGACHLYQHNDSWRLSPEDITGRTPKPEHIDESFSVACTEVSEGGKVFGVGVGLHRWVAGAVRSDQDACRPK